MHIFSFFCTGHEPIIIDAIINAICAVLGL